MSQTAPSSFSKTRLAPTPSGYLHAGNAFNFLLTAALAKQAGARMLLRIDDLDRERYRPAYANDVFETLRFLNISWDEGPQSLSAFEESWSQRHRLPLYNHALENLRRAGAVFACTCSRTQSAGCLCSERRLPLDTPHANWRLLTGDDSIAVRSLDGTLRCGTLSAEMKNFVVRKKDGLPAYQLTSLADDLHFGIDLVVRGEDLWPSTVAQHLLAQHLGEERFSRIRFFHHPLLTASDGRKLSKSAGDTSVKHWREEGKTLAGLVAYISRGLHLPVPAENGQALLRALMPE